MLCSACICVVYCSMQYNGGKDMTSGSFTSTADIDFFVDVDANGTELVIVSDNITTRHQVSGWRLRCCMSGFAQAPVVRVATAHGPAAASSLKNFRPGVSVYCMFLAMLKVA